MFDLRIQKIPPFYGKESYIDEEDNVEKVFYRILENDKYRLGSPEEVKGMEYEFIWFSDFIEKRIKNHFAGIEYKLDPHYLIGETEIRGYPTDPDIIGV